MKTFAFLILALASFSAWAAPVFRVPLQVDKDTSEIIGRSNFFAANSNAITAAIRPALPTELRTVLSPFRSLSGSSNLYTIGDSHTVGQVNIPGVSNWVESGFIKPGYRYPNILAGRWGLNLSNLAVSGSAISQGNPGTTGVELSSSLWQASQMGPRWSGVATVMHGYNDGYLWQDSASVLGWFESAQAATIATLFATNWAGPGGTNWDGVAVSGWSNTGTILDEGGSTAGKALFPPAGGLGGNRTSVRLLTGNAWTASLSGRVGLVLERWMDGGVVAIFTNGVVMAQRVLDTRGNGYASTSRRLPVLHLLDLPTATTVSVSGLSGTNLMLGVVWVGNPDDVANRRVVLSSSTPLGDTAIRSDGMIAGIGLAGFRAASTWKEWPLWVAAAGASIDPRSDVYSTDKSHPGPSGHRKLVEGFEQATRPAHDAALSALGQIEVPYVRSYGAVQAFGGGAVGQDYSRPAASLSFAGGYGAFLDSMGGGLGVLSNLYLRGYNVAVQYGGLSVINSSTLGAVPKVPALHLSFAGGEGYLDGYDYGASVWKPINYRSLSHRFNNGALSVLGATLSTNDMPQVPGLHLSYIGDQAYFDAYNHSNGSFKVSNYRAKSHRFASGGVSVTGAYSSTNDAPQVGAAHLGFADGNAYLDAIDYGSNNWMHFNYRSKSHRFGQGPLSVSASYLAVEDAPTVGAVHVSYGGGQGYVDSWDYGTVGAKPLNLRGSYVSIPTGPLLITAGSGSGIPTNGAAMIFQDGATAQFRGSRESGYMPAAVDGLSVKLNASGNPRVSISNNVVVVETNLVVRGSLTLGGVERTDWPSGGSATVLGTRTAGNVIADTGTDLISTNSIDGARIGTGTVADARIDSAIARDSEVTSAVSVGRTNFTAGQTIASFGAFQAHAPASNPATSSTRNALPVLEFDASTPQQARWLFQLPNGYSSSTVTVILRWTTTATSGNGRWGARFWDVTGVDVDSDSFATAVEVTTACSGTAGTTVATTLSGVNLDGTAGGEIAILEVYRDVGDAADTINSNTLQLPSVEVRAE